MALLVVLVVVNAGIAGAGASGSPAGVRGHPITSENVGGVPLIATSKAQRLDCRRLATSLHRPVPCPSLVPEPLAVSPDALACYHGGVCGPATVYVGRSSLLMTGMNFVVPRGYVGVSVETYTGLVPDTSTSGGPMGHFVFETGTSLTGEYRPGSDKMASALPSYCARVHLGAPVRIHGTVGSFYECADSSNDRDAIETVQGHDLLEWRQDGLLCQVSFHGHSALNFDLDVAMAKATMLVRPRR